LIAILEDAPDGASEGSLVNLANREGLDTRFRPDTPGVEWPKVCGFFREYLADLLPALQFDVVDVRCEYQDDGLWHCFAQYLAGEESYALQPHDAFDLLRGVELEDSFVTWPIAIQAHDARLIHQLYLRVPRDAWDALPKTHRRDDLIGIFDSLPGAYVFVLLADIGFGNSGSAEHPLAYDEFRAANRQPHGARFRGFVQPHGATRFSGSWSRLQGGLRWIFSLMEPPDFQGHGAISRRLAG
jgi:hypothetical protein